MEGDETLSDKPTVQYLDDIYICILEAYIMFLTNVTPVSLI